MDLDRNPFVDSARRDLAEGHTSTVTVTDLLGPAPAVIPGIDLDLHEQHAVTATFLSLWGNLSEGTRTSRNLLLSVMHGITIEHRHPAHRVTPTNHPDIYQSNVGGDTTLVFTLPATAPHHPIWLAVLHNH